MKYISFLSSVLFLSLSLQLFSQNVGVGTNTPHPSAMLDVTSSNKGVLWPRMPKANRPINPTNGLIIYQTDSIAGFYYYQNGNWSRLQDATFDLKFNSFGPDTTVTFNHTGAVQTWVVPNNVHWVKINCRGAEGATGVFHTPNVNISFNPGGKGGISEGILKVTPGETLYVHVGGFVSSPTLGTNGQVIPGGYNGGGDVIVDVSINTHSIPGAGGGASDVRQGGTTLAHRKIVAGGGGGGGTNSNIVGGFGGGMSGGTGNCFVSGSCAQGGTQTTGFALGEGMDANVPFRGAGGGGFYGGFASAINVGAGGGGSGYLHPQLINATTTANMHSLHGVITIIYNRNTTLDTLTSFKYPLSSDVIADAVNLANYGNNAVLYSNNDSIKGNSQQFFFNPSTNSLGVGTNTPAAKLEVKGIGGAKFSSTNPGTGTSDWIAMNAGGNSGDRIVMGTLNGRATLGAHNAALNAWDTLALSPGGKIFLPGLGNTTKKLLMVDQNGMLKDTNMVSFGNGLVSNNNQVQLGGSIQNTTQLSLNGQSFNFNNNYQNGVFVDIPWDLPWATDAVPIGQTFNLPVGGTLTGFRIFPAFFSDGNTCTWQIYQGSFTDGTLLASGSVIINAPDILIPVNINFSANTTYYIHLINSRNRINLNNPFPYGTEIFTNTGTPNPQRDLVLQLVGNVTMGSAMTIRTGGFGTGASSSTINIASLAGSATRIVNASATGDLGTQTIASIQDNLGNHSASQSLIMNGQLIKNSTSATKGITLNDGGNIGIGTPPTSSNAVTISGTGGIKATSTNGGTGVTDWISGNFGGTFGNRVVAGIYEGHATIGAHTENLSTWAHLNINNGGTVGIPGLSGTGFRFITASPTGVLSATTPIQDASASQTGLLSSGNWIAFNSKVDPSRSILTSAPLTGGGNLSTDRTIGITQAGTSSSGFLSNTDWNTFNNKVSTTRQINTSGPLSGGGDLSTNRTISIAQANASTDGFLSTTDWNTFNNKFNLPSLTNGSIIYANGTTLVEANGQLHYIASTQRVGVGTGSPASKLDVQGEKGISVNSTNNGSGTTDWIAINAGGTSGDRVVTGVLNGSATIGAHNQLLNAWDTLVVNPDVIGTSIVLGGDKSKTTPQVYGVNSSAPRPVAVNGSIRQTYYFETVNIAAGGTQSFIWTHNLGYGPIVMMSTDQNGGGANMVHVSYTTYNNDANNTVFLLRNNGSATATGTFRWIVVW